ncbi:MAG: hypothetical protein SVN78_04100 [Deferribacterota bacterium]|nr:hypothetical protein [Deferribacterota bacterium]
MLTLIISLSLSALIYLGTYYFTFNHIVSSILAVITLFLVNFLIGRKVFKKLNGLFTSIQKDMNLGHYEKAIKKLNDGLRLSKWQFMIKKQINSQLGIIYYLKKDKKKAKDYLLKGTLKNYIAASMLATLYYKEKKYDKCKEVMEKAIKASKKEGFLYSLYAYFLYRMNEKGKAIEILNKGVKKAPLDEKLNSNLDALKNGKKIKMQNYGQIWLQLNIDKVPEGIRPYHMILANKRFKPR